MMHGMGKAGWWVAAVLLTGCTAGSAPTQRQLQGIVGGEETTEWPEVVALILGEGTILCTGTLIAPDVILTAAHCGVVGVPGDVAYFGSSIFEEGEVVEIAAIENHPDYDEENPRHDLAIAFLAEESDVVPAQIDTRSLDSTWTGTTMHAVGFGNEDSYTGETGGIKRETDVDISGVDTHILYHETPGQNTCSGDSGGPLFVEEGEGWVQVAVASFVYPIDTHEDYCSGGGGDVRLDTHLEWIEEVVELGLVLQEEDEDDDTDEVSYLEDDDSVGCAASVAPRRRPVGWLAAVLLALGLVGRSISRASWTRRSVGGVRRGPRSGPGTRPCRRP
jgi:secreted trypsin-like serine protease